MRKLVRGSVGKLDWWIIGHWTMVKDIIIIASRQSIVHRDQVLLSLAWKYDLPIREDHYGRPIGKDVKTWREKITMVINRYPERFKPWSPGSRSQKDRVWINLLPLPEESAVGMSEIMMPEVVAA